MSWRFFFRAIAEDIPFEEIVDELKDFDERFIMILRKHIAVLGWWCLLNFVSGVVGLFFTEGFWWYFFLMNISWAVINFLVVVWIFNHVFFRKFTKGKVVIRLRIQYHMEKMLFANVGLDLAYIFCGLFFYALSKNPELSYPELWAGFGVSIFLQGIYLFFQDNIFHQMHLRNFKKARPFIESLMETKNFIQADNK